MSVVVTSHPIHPRVDARLAAWLAADPERLVATLRAHERAGSALSVGLHEGPDGLWVRALVRVTGEGVALDRWAEVVARTARVAVVHLPLRDVPSLARTPGVRFVQAARPLWPDLDAAVPATGAQDLRLVDGLDGTGVLVASVEAERPNLLHPDFVAAGTSRVVALWDDRNFGGGTVYGQADVQAALANPLHAVALSYGTVGTGDHPTLVLGCAAGNGAYDGVHVGAATGADVGHVTISVTGYRRLGDDAKAVAAIAWLFDQAVARGQPCVVNLSMSDNLGPHDGSMPLEIAIDDEVATPGHVVVVSAGNQDAEGKHVEGILPAVGDLDLDLIVPAGLTAESLEVWYDGIDDVTVSLVAPSGAVVGPFARGTTTLAVVDSTDVTVTHRDDDPLNGDRSAYVILDGVLSGTVAAGTWTLRLTVVSRGGAGSVHAWIDRNSSLVWSAPVAGHVTLGCPSASAGAITVGNHDDAGLLHVTSARGPARTGHLKPDVAAPGSSIVGPGKLGALAPSMSGTSFSAPIVAGICAQLLQHDPALRAVDLKYLLRSTADATGIAPGETGFGTGRVSVAGALAALGATHPDVHVLDTGADVGVVPSTRKAWHSTAVWLRQVDDGLRPHQPALFGATNYVYVSVRNLGTGVTFDSRVALYVVPKGAVADDPSTWVSADVRVGGEAIHWQVIPSIQPGKRKRTPLPFTWTPPVLEDVRLVVVAESDLEPVDLGVVVPDITRALGGVAGRRVKVV